MHRVSLTVTLGEGEPLPLSKSSLPTGQQEPTLTISFTTKEDAAHRAAAAAAVPAPVGDAEARRRDAAEIARPRSRSSRAATGCAAARCSSATQAGCAKCHRVRGQGSDLGPDLSNLVHRDYDSVLRDIREPSGALNPDYIASAVR